MWGVRLGGAKEHSPSITGVSVDDTSMNCGFSLRKSFRRASARSACDHRVQYDGVGKAERHKPTKRFDLEHTRYAYQPGVQNPAVAVAVCPNILQGPEGGTPRGHDMAVAEGSCTGSGRATLQGWVVRAGWRAGVECRTAAKRAFLFSFQLHHCIPQAASIACKTSPRTDIFPSIFIKFLAPLLLYSIRSSNILCECSNRTRCPSGSERVTGTSTLYHNF